MRGATAVGERWQYRTDWIDSTNENRVLDYINKPTFAAEGWCVFHFEKYEMEDKTVVWCRRLAPDSP